MPTELETLRMFRELLLKFGHLQSALEQSAKLWTDPRHYPEDWSHHLLKPK